MKKIALLFIAILSFYSNVYAEELTATLRQEGQTIPFYGPNALIDAFAAADSGAVIILSTGQFNNLGSISKSVTIIGAYGFDVYPGQGNPAPASTKTALDSTIIYADNVTLEGIYFSGSVTLGGVNNCHIKRCQIETALHAMAYHTNTKIDQCVVKYDDAIGESINYYICNSTIGSLKNSSGYKACVTNCFIYDLFTIIDLSGSNFSDGFVDVSFTNNVIALDFNGNPSGNLYLAANYINNCFYIYSKGYWEETEEDDIKINCIYGFLENNTIVKTSNQSIDHVYPNTSTGWGTGIDGTPIGVTGGQGFVAYPHIPHIISSTIDDHIDAEGKTNVIVNVSVTQ